jgi:hypothetical protein
VVSAEEAATWEAVDCPTCATDATSGHWYCGMRALADYFIISLIFLVLRTDCAIHSIASLCYLHVVSGSFVLSVL